MHRSSTGASVAFERPASHADNDNVAAVRRLAHPNTAAAFVKRMTFMVESRTVIGPIRTQDCRGAALNMRRDAFLRRQAQAKEKFEAIAEQNKSDSSAFQNAPTHGDKAAAEEFHQRIASRAQEEVASKRQGLKNASMQLRRLVYRIDEVDRTVPANVEAESSPSRTSRAGDGDDAATQSRAGKSSRRGGATTAQGDSDSNTDSDAETGSNASTGNGRRKNKKSNHKRRVQHVLLGERRKTTTVLTPEDYFAARAIFVEMDTDGSGFIELGELLAFRKLYPRRLSLDAFQHLMVANDAKIYFDQFLAIHFPQISPDRLEHYIDLYEMRVFDMEAVEPDDKGDIARWYSEIAAANGGDALVYEAASELITSLTTSFAEWKASLPEIEAESIRKQNEDAPGAGSSTPTTVMVDVSQPSPSPAPHARRTSLVDARRTATAFLMKRRMSVEPSLASHGGPSDSPAEPPVSRLAQRRVSLLLPGEGGAPDEDLSPGLASHLITSLRRDSLASTLAPAPAAAREPQQNATQRSGGLRSLHRHSPQSASGFVDITISPSTTPLTQQHAPLPTKGVAFKFAGEVTTDARGRPTGPSPQISSVGLKTMQRTLFRTLPSAAATLSKPGVSYTPMAEGAPVTVMVQSSAATSLNSTLSSSGKATAASPPLAPQSTASSTFKVTLLHVYRAWQHVWRNIDEMARLAELRGAPLMVQPRALALAFPSLCASCPGLLQALQEGLEGTKAVVGKGAGTSKAKSILSRRSGGGPLARGQVARSRVASTILSASSVRSAPRITSGVGDGAVSSDEDEDDVESLEAGERGYRAVLSALGGKPVITNSASTLSSAPSRGAGWQELDDMTLPRAITKGWVHPFAHFYGNSAIAADPPIVRVDGSAPLVDVLRHWASIDPSFAVPAVVLAAVPVDLHTFTLLAGDYFVQHRNNVTADRFDAELGSKLRDVSRAAAFTMVIDRGSHARTTMAEKMAVLDADAASVRAKSAKRREITRGVTLTASDRQRMALLKRGPGLSSSTRILTSKIAEEAEIKRLERILDHYDEAHR